MDHAYVGVSNLKCEIVVAVNIAAQGGQVLLRIGYHLHSEFRRTRKTANFVVEGNEFVGQLAYLGEASLGDFSLAIGDQQSDRKTSDDENQGGRNQPHR